MGAWIERQIERLQRGTAVSVVVVWGASVAAAYLAMWMALEPATLGGPLGVPLVAKSWRMYLVVALLIAAHVTLLLIVAARGKKRVTSNISTDDLAEFNAQFEERFLPQIARLHQKQLDETTIRSIMMAAVGTASMIHFGIEALPTATNRGFATDRRYACGICLGRDVGILKSGQCPHCKLDVAKWGGDYRRTQV